MRPNNPFANDLDPDGTIRRQLAGPSSPRAAFDTASPFGTPGRTGAPPPSFAIGGDPLGRPSDRPGLGDFDFPARPAFGRDGGGFSGGEGPLGAGLRLGSESAVEQAFDLAALNPLVGVASPLLWLAARLNESVPVDDVPLFRTRVLEEVGRFETNALARGIPQRSARVARYALAATIDDIILNTSWGGQSDWPAKGLVSTLYQETWGGERFFDLLGQLYAQPDENIDALELMAVCLSIGFVGKYRVVEGGGGHLNRLRAELYRTIRRIRGPQERALSGSFSAVAAPYKAPARMIWFWIAGLAALLALVLLYLILGLMLSWRVDAAAEKVAALAPAVPVFVEGPNIPSVPSPFVTIPQTQVERISSGIADDIAGGDVEVVEAGGIVAVRLLRASFPVGGTALSESEAPMVSRIAAALDAEPGTVTVVGHTDNVPISNPTPTRNNQTLSRDRAGSAASMLQRFLADPARVLFEGRGDATPIASNATAAGRARNRRVEFQIPAEETLR